MICSFFGAFSNREPVDEQTGASCSTESVPPNEAESRVRSTRFLSPPHTRRTSMQSPATAVLQAQPERRECREQEVMTIRA